MEIHIVLHFEGGIPFAIYLLCHIFYLCRRSSCSWSPSCSFEMTPYSNASSAKSLSEHLRLSGTSFTYSRNSSAPKTVPCGTPVVIGEGSSGVSNVCVMVPQYVIYRMSGIKKIKGNSPLRTGGKNDDVGEI